ncbi:hypothetical protein [Corallococcus aberystwythensis]|uniref:DUF4034 domain-containing protein n=1 Tax=Corallococcus aberystwythensis TaxID=2316722 RepID=A0A3A8QNT4_9BACT|nr:hypothetical protein [Corallococcus aberystwythensis]RKH70416.1 hypothetical protein D7W81_09320 [Corallococcus aberystwythensis]
MKNARTVLGLVGLAVLLPPVIAEACGPDFPPDPLFEVRSNPDRPFDAFVAGRLGIVRDTFRPRYLAFAWRSMMGIPTTAEEQKHLVDGWRVSVSRYGPDASWASEQWLAVRREVVPSAGEENPQLDLTGEAGHTSYSRIHGDAFLHAAVTARALAKEWKRRPALLKEWRDNQDNVFNGGCQPYDPTPGIEEGLTPREKARRQVERDYQTAAMNLYCGSYDEAAAGFQALADNAEFSSRPLAAYLVARTRVRQALFSLPDWPDDPPKVDAAQVEARFKQADEALQKVLADPKLREVHGPARRLLSVVRWRLSPETWQCELFSQVLEKGTGSGLESALAGIAVGRGADGKDITCPGLKPRAAELFDWLHQMTLAPRRQNGQETPESAKTFATAVARWKKTAHVPWLLFALLTARADAPEVPGLLADAQKVPVESSAGLTLAWRSVQLLRERGQLTEARARLDAIPVVLVRDLPSSDNLLREERLHLASSWDEALRNAAQFVVDEDGTGLHQDWSSQAPELASQGLSPARAYFLESHLPTRRLREWAALPGVNPELRRQLSWAVFARAAVVGDDATLKAQAATLAEAEPKARAELLAILGRPTVEERLFDARLLVMGLPAVSARLEPNRDRLATLSPELDLTEDVTWYRNGWCVPGTKDLEDPLKTPLPFASPEERSDAAAEWKALNAAGPSVSFFSRVALDWAKAHPADPRSPIALFRAVRSSKKGCAHDTAEVKKAFAYLHKHYGKTEWARRAPYYY